MQDIDLLNAVMKNDAQEIERIMSAKNYILYTDNHFGDLFTMHRRDLAMIGIYLEEKDYLLEDHKYDDGLVTFYEILNGINKDKAKDFAIDILYAAKLSKNMDVKTIFLELIKY